MSNKVIIYIIASLAVAGAIGGTVYVVTKPKTATTPLEQNTNTPPALAPAPLPVPVQEEGMNEATFNQLIAKGETLSCTFEDKADGSNTTGTIYVDHKRLRSDFSTASEDKAVNGHMIMTSGMAYTWVEGMTTGIKASLEGQTKAGESQGVDANKKLNIHCNAWTNDETKFSVPTQVKFSDITSLIPEVPSMPKVKTNY